MKHRISFRMLEVLRGIIVLKYCKKNHRDMEGNRRKVFAICRMRVAMVAGLKSVIMASLVLEALSKLEKGRPLL